MSELVKKFGLLLITGLILFSCKDKDTVYKPNVVGKAGELLIVMDDKIKQSEAGKELQRVVIRSERASRKCSET